MDNFLKSPKYSDSLIKPFNTSEGLYTGTSLKEGFSKSLIWIFEISVCFFVTEKKFSSMRFDASRPRDIMI